MENCRFMIKESKNLSGKFEKDNLGRITDITGDLLRIKVDYYSDGRIEVNGILFVFPLKINFEQQWTFLNPKFLIPCILFY